VVLILCIGLHSKTRLGLNTGTLLITSDLNSGTFLITSDLDTVLSY